LELYFELDFVDDKVDRKFKEFILDVKI